MGRNGQCIWLPWKTEKKRYRVDSKPFLRTRVFSTLATAGKKKPKLTKRIWKI
ncbi:BnaC02g24480D [Brassica napus]|uniref:BnaC02g24480D protein n=1 Tax=Brassica napus TaxID=3708 RepID=A0A078G6W0_BRANA|nr:BnaC02g24480D [Brassica napus]